MFPLTGIPMSYMLTIQPSIQSNNLSSVTLAHPCVCRSRTNKQRSDPLP